MIQQLTSLLGKNINSDEFKTEIVKIFPDYKGFDKNKEYKDKASKITLRIDCLTMNDDSVEIPADENEYKYFIAFFFGKDETEIPFGLSVKDNEETVLKKAGKPTHQNKVTTGGFFNMVNQLHYYFDTYKIIVSFDPETGKSNQNIQIHQLLKGMKF